MTEKATSLSLPNWKALLVILLAGGGLLWQVLACTESPMAFSPDGKELAMVTVEPFDEENFASVDTHAYRLMILSDQKELQVLEESSSHMLTAPGYSPDGKQLCYLRVPLLTPENREILDTAYKQMKQNRHDRPTSQPALKWSTEGPTSQPTSSPWGQFDVEETVLFPYGERLQEFYLTIESRPWLPATLVIRDTATKEVLSEVLVDLPMRLLEKMDIDFLISYATIRPQYSPEGKKIYLFAGEILISIELDNMQLNVLSVLPCDNYSKPVVLLSPDGKMLATFLPGKESGLGFFSTERPVAVFTGALQGKLLSKNSIAWVNNQTLAVFAGAGDQKELDALYLIGTDGRLLKTFFPELPEHKREDKHNFYQELAISPDGQHAVISFQGDTFFMDMTGEVLGLWHHEKDFLDQPVFTPDSQQVAFKYMSDEEHRAAAIVFFSPEGKMLSRVEIPPATLPTTPPASQPAGQPASEPASQEFPWTP